MVRRSWPWRSADDRVQLVDRETRPAPAPGALLLRIAAEAVLLQDEAEAVLAAVAHHDHLGVVAPRAGPLVSRFFGLREELPGRCDDPRLERLRTVLDTIFYHHAMQLATALEFLTFDGRSEQLHRQISEFTGLGAPAVLLEDVYRELRGPG
ncbi:hypothetical protein SAMN04488543_2004 [Friedmanniella luteola]|uniref:Uncharacterized protein n=1 Tax=Friedmanniella luteola TaxID=546871 RepID=A0A1H1TDU0_9ACTN|nr:hypothetical protein [Friedmanniella luteola]SDS58485.1 hypothetical protein SAMN04488543_2004 [Friedmanniella luteola]